jgi:hypothetical protein
MKRRFAAVLASSLLAALVILIPASPASAGTDVCVGNGTANVPSPGLTYPGVGSGQTLSGVTFTFAVGVCAGTSVPPVRSAPLGVLGPLPVPFATVDISGPLGAFCGQSVGTNGTADGHHGFGYVSAGSLLLVHPPVGQVVNTAVGLVNATPDVTTSPPQSCLTGARQFLVTGVVLLVGP